MQLARDRANAPFFDMIIAQDLRLQIGRDGHGVLLGEVWRRIELVRRRVIAQGTGPATGADVAARRSFAVSSRGDGLATSPGEADGGLLALSTALAITKSSERCDGEP
jgi:hypothetical protein